jgi:hypothetical protein
VQENEKAKATSKSQKSKAFESDQFRIALGCVAHGPMGVDPIDVEGRGAEEAQLRIDPTRKLLTFAFCLSSSLRGRRHAGKTYQSRWQDFSVHWDTGVWRTPRNVASQVGAKRGVHRA